MISAKSKFDLYEKIKHRLQQQGFTVNPFREIDYGLQFLVFYQEESEMIRIYESKKGIRVDYSQVKNEAFLNKVTLILDEKPVVQKPLIDPDEDDVTKLTMHQKDPDDLIGVDESGKGDYFGPLVIAGVRVTPELHTMLDGLGIDDSKKLSDKAIIYLAQQITKRTQHAVIVMGNQSYNDIYDKFENLNHILAWGHMKVIEDTLKQGDCKNALCDQFGNASLLKNAMRAKNININLFQRPRAETNIAVACASILARYNYITQLQKMSDHFGFNFPKGSTRKVLDAGVKFVEEHGKDNLFSVCKLHFKVTEQLEARLQQQKNGLQ